MQRKMNGEVVITSSAVKEKFRNLNAITVGSQSYAVHDNDRPLTFLTVYDAPFELGDWAIIEVKHQRFMIYLGLRFLLRKRWSEHILISVLLFS